MRDEVRNRHIHRAALDAGRILAMQAAVSFLHGDFAGVAQRDFLEIRRADVRLLLRHRMLLKTHVRHYRTPPVRRHLWSFSIARCSSGRNMRLREIASRPVHLMPIKVWAVHAREFRHAANRHAAAAAHARAINHNRVHGHDGLDVLGLVRSHTAFIIGSGPMAITSSYALPASSFA